VTRSTSHHKTTRWSFHFSSSQRVSAKVAVTLAVVYQLTKVELRNRIYHFFAVHEERHVRIRKADEVSGVFTGLTGVSQQVRSEYRPIQRSVTQVTICCNDINDFVNTFLTTHQDRVHPFKSICISEQNWTTKSQDLLPLVKEKVANSAFWCRFEADVDQREDDPSSQAFGRIQQIEYQRGCVTALNEMLNNENAGWRGKIVNDEITALRLYIWALPFHGLHVSFGSGHIPQGIIAFRTGDDKEKMAEFFNHMWKSWGFTPDFRKFLVVKHCEDGIDIGHY
jgi:hypothetical protein